MTNRGYIFEVPLIAIMMLRVGSALICHECDERLDEFPIKGVSILEKDFDYVEGHFCKENELGKPKSCKDGEVCGKHFFEGYSNNLFFNLIARVCQPKEEFTSCKFFGQTSTGIKVSIFMVL